MKRNWFLLLSFGSMMATSTLDTKAQDTTWVSSDSIILEIIGQEQYEAFDFQYSIVSYDSTADVLIKPVTGVGPAGGTEYEIELRLNPMTATPLYTFTVSDTDEITALTGIVKDTSYYITGYKLNGNDPRTSVPLNHDTISTKRQETIYLTIGLYAEIAAWTSDTTQSTSLYEHLMDNRQQFDVLELVSFIQYHYGLDGIQHIVLEGSPTSGLNLLNSASRLMTLW